MQFSCISLKTMCWMDQKDWRVCVTLLFGSVVMQISWFVHLIKSQRNNEKRKENWKSKELLKKLGIKEKNNLKVIKK